jgi:hypothetical protein
MAPTEAAGDKRPAPSAEPPADQKHAVKRVRFEKSVSSNEVTSLAIGMPGL